MQNVYADLAVEAEAATMLAMHLAQAFDAAHHGDAVARAYSRLATAIAKYYVCKRAPGVVYEAMECFGGYACCLCGIGRLGCRSMRPQ
jgi:putative acyl-CoA dehydrogenase